MKPVPDDKIVEVNEPGRRVHLCPDTASWSDVAFLHGHDGPGRQVLPTCPVQENVCVMSNILTKTVDVPGAK
jgi:hypothetical protein